MVSLRPWQVERSTHTYVRAPWHNFTLRRPGCEDWPDHRRHRALERRTFLQRIEANVPVDLAFHLILDNYGTHKTPTILRWLAKRPRSHLHVTPTSVSWWNRVER